MLSVTQLARLCGVSRTTVLYYESLGLLPRPPRSRGNYRQFDDRHLDRLRQICAYRSAGLKLGDMRVLLAQPRTQSAATVLARRLAEIGVEIERLKDHQRAIMRLLSHRNSLEKGKPMDKEKWVEIMRASGLADADMQRWHREFEKARRKITRCFWNTSKYPHPKSTASAPGPANQQ